MHTFTVEAFEKRTPSEQIVSHEQRIIHLSYYFSDIPIATYCSLVAVIQPNEELGQLLKSPTGRETPVHAVSESIRKALAPAQAKSRTRLVSILDMLRTLRLVTPLVPSDSSSPALSCPEHGQHPAAFDLDLDAEYTPTAARESNRIRAGTHACVRACVRARRVRIERHGATRRDTARHDAISMRRAALACEGKGRNGMRTRWRCDRG